MSRARLLRGLLGPVAVSLLLAVAGSAEAQLPFGTRAFPPSWYGFELDEQAAGYFGGGRYTRYYAYGRGNGVSIADFPSALPTAPYPWFGPGKRMPTGQESTAVHRYPAPVHIICWVPDNAEIWVEETKTSSTGAAREFISPPLEPGIRHHYNVRARWTGPDGKEVEQAQVVGCFAGDRAVVRFPVQW